MKEKFRLDGLALLRIGAGLVAGEKFPKIAADLGITASKLRVVLRTMGVYKPPKGGGRRGGAHSSQRRLGAPQNQGAVELPATHEAVVEATTLYRNSDLRDPAESDRPVLISGRNNPKLGAKVKVGGLAGLAIYHLTLEERATCPRACAQWRTCYGNAMHLAARHKHGRALEDALRRDVPALLKKHSKGILVRLHTLGDFYSLDYVRCWAELLERHDRLHIWGYTRRHPGDGDKIGDALMTLRNDYWERFAMRFSDLTGPRNAFVLKGRAEAPRIGDAFVCKQEWAAQNGDLTSMTCGTCAACWESNDPVVFVEH